MNFTRLPILWTIALGTLVFIAGCADHKLVADASATWSARGDIDSHTHALELIKERFSDEEDSVSPSMMTVVFEKQTPDALLIKIAMTKNALAEYQQKMVDEDIASTINIPDWHLFQLAGSTEENGDITFRLRLFVPTDFRGYDEISDEKRGDLVRGMFPTPSTILGYPTSAHFYFPDLGGFPDDDNE